MYFTQVRRAEYLSGVPMYSLEEPEPEVVLNAIRHVAKPDIEGGAQTVIATLATGRTWVAAIPGKTPNHVYIYPRPGLPFAAGFWDNQKHLDSALAARLGRQVGTASISIVCNLAISGQGQFSLDTSWLHDVLKHCELQSAHIPDANTFGECLVYSDTCGEMLCFYDQTQDTRLFVDATRLGPLVDDNQRRVRKSGYGALQGPAYSDACEVTLTLTNVHNFAFDTHQQKLRHYAQKILELVAPPG